MGKIKFTTTIDENLLEQIKILAIKEKCSVASILEKLISDYLKSNSEENKSLFFIHHQIILLLVFFCFFCH